jgi:hypothetical protein
VSTGSLFFYFELDCDSRSSEERCWKCEFGLVETD